MIVKVPRIGRLQVKHESAEENDLIEEMCCGAIWRSGYWNMEDTLYNRYVLDIEYKIAKPPGNKLFDVSESIISFYDKLHDYQQKDVIKMQDIAFPLNANKPGYGKTIEALFYAVLTGSKKILIVAPKSVLFQWKNQVDRWYLPYFPNCLIQIVQKTSEKLGAADIVILNYEKCINDNILRQLKDYNFDLIIADEGHRLRNPKAKQTKALKSIKSKLKLILTGTPILNKPDNLWSIMHWLNPWYFGSAYWHFVESFCYVKEDFFGKHIEGLTKHKGRAQALSEVLNLIMVRQEGLHIGNGVREIDVTLDMYGSQLSLYKKVKKLAIEELMKEGVSVTNGLDQLIKLQQLTSDPELFECNVNVKFEWLMDTINDAEGTKFLIFSRFKTPLKRLAKKMGKKAVSITGDVSPKDRDVAKEKFINDPYVQCMLGTIGAMGEGIDGLQHVCQYVIFLDKMWNPEENNQAIARLLRDGQENEVIVYSLTCKDSIDEKVGRVNVSKLEDIIKVLGN